MSIIITPLPRKIIKTIVTKEQKNVVIKGMDSEPDFYNREILALSFISLRQVPQPLSPSISLPVNILIIIAPTS